jgi:hypothetical protein
VIKIRACSKLVSKASGGQCENDLPIANGGTCKACLRTGSVSDVLRPVRLLGTTFFVKNEPIAVSTLEIWSNKSVEALCVKYEHLPE